MCAETKNSEGENTPIIQSAAQSTKDRMTIPVAHGSFNLDTTLPVLIAVLVVNHHQPVLRVVLAELVVKGALSVSCYFHIFILKRD